MKISIALPAHNEEKYIKRTLKSLFNQNYKDYEIIVCLNACTDSTEKIVQELQDESPVPVHIIKEKIKGVSLARNKASWAGSGEIIASADADTIYPSFWIKRIADDFKKDKKMVALYGPVYLQDGPLYIRMIGRCFYPLFLYISRIFGNDNVAGMNFAFKKKIFDRVSGYNTELKSAEDIDLAKRLKIFGKIAYDRRLIAWTSGRRFRLGFWKFLEHHTKNYFRMFFLKKKPIDFKDIR